MNGRNKAMCYTKDIHSYRKFSRNQIKEGIRMSSIETFLQMVKESDNIVFFGGAGVSTESGIPDFRSVDGLYNQKYDYPIPRDAVGQQGFFFLRRLCHRGSSSLCIFASTDFQYMQRK